MPMFNRPYSKRNTHRTLNSLNRAARFVRKRTVGKMSWGRKAPRSFRPIRRPQSRFRRY